MPTWDEVWRGESLASLTAWPPYCPSLISSLGEAAWAEGGGLALGAWVDSSMLAKGARTWGALTGWSKAQSWDPSSMTQWDTFELRPGGTPRLRFSC